MSLLDSLHQLLGGDISTLKAVGRQINPFDRGASRNRPISGNTGIGAPLPPGFFKPQGTTPPSAPYIFPQVRNNLAPFVTQAGVPYQYPQGRPINPNHFNPSLFRAIPMTPQDELNPFPLQHKLNRIP